MTDEFEYKRNRALVLLNNTTITERNYLPPFYSFLWKMGVKIPPPHFIKIHYLILITGLPYGFIWIGLFMMYGNNEIEKHIWITILIFFLISFVMGISISFYYKIGQIKFNLQKWEDL